MHRLVQGHLRFQSQAFPRRRELFDRLAGGQSPHTLWITCSDSRVDPSLITQTEPGELFVLRNAGNIVPPFGAAGSGEAAAIEFAVDGLHVRDVVVCGHSQCGAMAGLLWPDRVAGLPTVAEWVKHAEAVRRIVREGDGRGDEELLAAGVQQNVIAQLNNLRTHPSVAAALRGELTLHGWIYDIKSGTVQALNRGGNSFAPLQREELGASSRVA